MTRELAVLLAAVAFIVVGEHVFKVNPGWLAIGAPVLWGLVRIGEAVYAVRKAKLEERARHEAWRSRRAAGIKALEEVARRARHAKRP